MDRDSTPRATAAGPRHPGRCGRGGFPAAYWRLSPTRKLEWLGGDEAAGLVARGELQFNQLARQARRIHEQKRGVVARAPTPACVDDWERGQAFPPPADDPACAMRTAEHVVNEPVEARVLWPGYYVLANGVTVELALVINLLERDREDDGGRDRGLYTTDSPSAAAIQAAEHTRKQVVSTLHPKFDLETEDEQALREQLARYLAGAAKVTRIAV